MASIGARLSSLVTKQVSSRRCHGTPLLILVVSHAPLDERSRIPRRDVQSSHRELLCYRFFRVSIFRVSVPTIQQRLGGTATQCKHFGHLFVTYSLSLTYTLRVNMPMCKTSPISGRRRHQTGPFWPPETRTGTTFLLQMIHHPRD